MKLEYKNKELSIDVNKDKLSLKNCFLDLAIITLRIVAGELIFLGKAYFSLDFIYVIALHNGLLFIQIASYLISKYITWKDGFLFNLLGLSFWLNIVGWESIILSTNLGIMHENGGRIGVPIWDFPHILLYMIVLCYANIFIMTFLNRIFNRCYELIKPYFL